MMTIRPGFRRPGIVIPAVAIGGFCLLPVALKPVAAAAVMGLGALVAMALMFWLVMRPVRLEITETEVRASQGWARGQSGKNEALRSEIRSIHYLPQRISFRGPDGQRLMEPVNLWTVQDMLRAAEELQVPLYDDKSWKQPGQGRLVYDPAVGPAARRR